MKDSTKMKTILKMSYKLDNVYKTSKNEVNHLKGVRKVRFMSFLWH